MAARWDDVIPPAFERAGYACWLIPTGESRAALEKVIRVLANAPAGILGKHHAPTTSIFEPHLTLLAPNGRAATDLEFFAGALERSIAGIRKQLGAKPGQSMNLHMMLDWPAAGTGWFNAVFAPVTETTGGRAVMDLRRMLAKECGETPQGYGWFPFVDGEWFPQFVLAYSDPNTEGGLLTSRHMALRADMVVLAKETADFPMATASKEAVIVDIHGEVEDWKIVAVFPL